MRPTANPTVSFRRRTASSKMGRRRIEARDPPVSIEAPFRTDSPGRATATVSSHRPHYFQTRGRLPTWGPPSLVPWTVQDLSPMGGSLILVPREIDPLNMAGGSTGLE